MKSDRLEREEMLLIPERLFSPGVFAVSLAWMSVLHLLDYANNSNIAPAWQRVVVLLLMHVIPFACAALVLLLLRARVSAHILMILLIVAVVVGAGLRGYVQFYALDFISARPLDDLTFRITASLTNSSFAILISWAGASAIEAHKRRRQRLIEDRERLLLLRQEARHQLERMDSGAAEDIRRSLLASLDGRDQASSRQLVHAMQELIEQVVRPLSQYFEQQSDSWIPPDPPKRPLGIDWETVLRRAFRVNMIQFTPIAAILIFISLPNTFFNRGPVVALASVIHVLISYPMFALIKRIGARLSEAGSPRRQAIAFFVSLYVGGQTLGLTSWVYMRFQEPHFVYAVQAPFFTVFGGVLIAFAVAAISESQSMEAALQRAGDDLRWSLARAREMHRQQRRALAHALHGHVQSAIASAILRLEMSIDRSDDDPAVAQEVVDSLKMTIANVNLLSASNVSVEVVLDRIRATWAGIATVSASGGAAVADRLAKDTVLAIALNDLLTELAYNSIKHGSATVVDIDFAQSDERTLTVTVSDNGANSGPKERSGLGSALLDDCAIFWERTREGGRTRTLVQLPME